MYSMDPHLQYNQALENYIHGKLIQAKQICQLIPQPHADALHLIGIINYQIGREKQDIPLIQQAIEYIKQALSLQPEKTQYLQNLASAYQEIKDFTSAELLFEKLLANNHANTSIYYNYANLLKDKGDFIQANKIYNIVLALNPNHINALLNQGMVLHQLNNLHRSLENYYKILTLDPKHIEAHWNIALSLLLQGNFLDGWQEYEYRWQWPHFGSKLYDFSVPIWQGQQIAADKTILIWPEQGLGDMIMFASLMPQLITTYSNKWILACEARLVPILRRSFTEITVINKQAIDDINIKVQFAYHIPIGSIAKFICKKPSCFPRQSRYLQENLTLSSEVKQKYREKFKHKPLIGISWLGGVGIYNKIRSTSLQDWLEILKIDKYQFICLHHQDQQPELEQLATSHGISVYQDLPANAKDNLEYLLAQISAVELVISVDNTLAHISAAAGKKTWIMLPNIPDWRWQLQGSASLWYKAAYLYRGLPNKSIFREVAKNLSQLDFL